MESPFRSLCLVGLLCGLLCSCEEIGNIEAEIDDLDEVAVDEGAELENRGAIVVSDDLASKIAAAAPKDANGLPLWESRPGAKVALYLDFDGGHYKGEQFFRGIDLDGNRSRFGTKEQTAIIRAALEVAEGYKGFNINVTTSDSARKKASTWGWILITDDESTSGRSKIGYIGKTNVSYPIGWAGSQAVFSPPSAQRGYILIHELGHQFGLQHSGLYKSGEFFEWSELKQSRTADWMGGRDSYFSSYKWETSQTESSTSWQDPVKIIGSIAGFVSDGGVGSCHTVPRNHSDYCTSSCPCNEGEGDCDRDSQCATGLVCEERGSVDVCVKPSGGGGVVSCNVPVVNQGNGGTGYGECQGDCDRDSDCQSGLVCVQLNTGDSVPGCIGRSSNNYDYCVKPMCM